MKTIILIMIFFISVCTAQIKDLNRQQYFSQGSFEFAFFSNVGKSNTNIKSRTESPGSYLYNSEHSEEELYFILGASAGYYFFDNLSLEPEIDINFSSDNSSVILIGNLSYSFSKPAGNIIPFVKIGFGWSNFTDNSYWGAALNTNGFNIFNSGAGIKVRYAENMIFKLGINYRILTTSTENNDSTYRNESELTVKAVSFSLGTSFLF